MLRKIMTAASILTLVSSAAVAQTYSSVLVTEAIVYGASPTSIPVDRITGYSIQRFSSIGELVGTGGTFSSSLVWQAEGDQHGLYALYEANGTYSQTGASTLFQFTGGSSFVMYLDANLDTIFDQPMNGSTEWHSFNSSDDRSIAFGQAIYCGVNCGGFIASTSGTSTSFTLASPSGELLTFAPSGTQVISSSFDVAFVNALPEPCSIFLVGLGLVGLATSRCKSVKSKNA
jgi:hypothetical protein